MAKGARLLTGGQRRSGPGNWFEPTVLSHVDHSTVLMREESFGPVIGIQRGGSDEEAVALMNDTRYGLAAGVYTQDESVARALLSRVNAGSVYWNCCDRVSPLGLAAGLQRLWSVDPNRPAAGVGHFPDIQAIRAYQHESPISANCGRCLEPIVPSQVDRAPA